MSSIKTENHKSIFYPPGGLLIWIIIYVELLTFSFGLIAMIYYGATDSYLYHSSCLTLNKNLAFSNTIILLTSSYFMANAVQFHKINDYKKFVLYLKLTILFGILFVLLKSIDYYLKIIDGEFLTTNIFYSFYWMLTGFHLIHVLFGLCILTYFYVTFIKNTSTLEISDISAGAAFWHMCDLIWLLLFPVLYLLY